MKVEIWSDVMCPFCYIGKRKFEAAMTQFADSNNIELEWKSFQLSPDMVTDTSKNINQYLAEHKGISIEEAKRMNDYVTNMAKQVGLEYNFDKAIVANSFNAHRFSHFAKQHGKQDEAEEMLFRAYFTEGKNTGDLDVLAQLGAEIGLDTAALKTALESDTYAQDVLADITEAMQLGVRGVPFFVFDRKYAVSGAQDPAVFLQTLDKSFEEWRKANPQPAFEMVGDGPSCEPGKDCE
ncbi:MAG: DsbA family oxidoreductase [Bacteroidetes bacterium]|nr:MAG: DsbA family oxidoreductase [Bacteroidota bacterium]